MSSEIIQIMACDNETKSSVKDAESTAVLSSPYFGVNDPKFTNLSVKRYEYRDVSTDPSPIQIKISDKGEVEGISFSESEVPDLGIVDVSVDGSTLQIIKNDGTILRILNTEINEDSILMISKRIFEVAENQGSIRFIASKWEGIS